MPRNGSGTMSIPTTLVANALATAADLNTNFTDIGTALTGSLALDGQATMTGQLKSSDGVITAPGIGFGSDPNTGFYRSASGVIRASLDGTNTFTLSATTAAVTGNATVSGTCAVTGAITQGGDAVALATRTLTAGTGIDGGGTLAADRTFDLADTAVTPGAYIRATITVDQQGRLTAAAAGASELPTQTSKSGQTLTTDGSNASWTANNRVLARASVNVDASTISNEVNVASVSGTSTVTVTFTEALADTAYVVLATITNFGATDDQIIMCSTKGTTTVVFKSYRGGTAGLSAVDAFDFVIFG